MLNNIETIFYLYITDDELPDCSGIFAGFIDDTIVENDGHLPAGRYSRLAQGPDVELTYNPDEGMQFKTYEQAKDYICKNFCNRNLWRITNRYSIEVKQYNKVNWFNIKENLKEQI